MLDVRVERPQCEAKNKTCEACTRNDLHVSRMRTSLHEEYSCPDPEQGRPNAANEVDGDVVVLVVATRSASQSWLNIVSPRKSTLSLETAQRASMNSKTKTAATV